MEKKIQEFNRDREVMRLQRMFNDSSILEIVGVERKETRHSKFLEWLFKTPELNTVSQDSPIMHLFDVLVRRAEEQNKEIDHTFKKNAITRKSNVRIDEIKAELPTVGLKLQGKSGKIDLYIKAYDIANKKTIHICIENKVYSNEHDNQTRKYYAYLKGDVDDLSKNEEVDCEFDDTKYKCPTKEGDIVLFVFLTPSAEFIMQDNDALNKMCNCDKYIHINYQDIVNEILEPLCEDDATSSASIEKIKQYVCSLGIPGRESARQNKKEDTLSITAMAAGTEILSLSLNIYNKYFDLLSNAIFPNGNKSQDVFDAFKESHKDFILNLLCIQGLVETDDLKYHVIKLMTLRMNGKYKNLLVKVKGKHCILNQSEFAVTFAKLYCEIKYNGSINDVDQAIFEMNEEFSNNDMNNNLFGRSQYHREDNNAATNSLIYKDKDRNIEIYFANNCWGATAGLPKIVEFINKQTVVPKTVFAVIQNR